MTDPRLSASRDTDIILVVEDGRIVAQGAHDELRASRSSAPTAPGDTPEMQESTIHDTP